MTLLALAALSAALAAEPQGPGWTPVPRKVIALYRKEQIDGDDKDLFNLIIHQRAETVLNYLGLDVEYVDADGPLPDPASRPDVRGVVTWFRVAASFPDPRPVCRWLSGMMGAGKRVAMLGQVGVFERSGQAGRLSTECGAALRTLGVKAGAFRNADSFNVSVSSASALMGFERKPDPTEEGQVPVMHALPGGKAQFVLRFSEGEPATTEPVVLTPRGAVALDPFLLYQNSSVDPPAVFWVTDPFALFEAALGLEGLPRPDTTTLNGRRVFFSHIDGDGFYNLTETDRKKIAGEIFWREIFSKEMDSPFTVSLIAGYYDLTLYNDAASLDISRRVLKQVNVEPASHGYAHPLVWRTGEVALAIPRYKMDAAKEITGSRTLLQERILPGSAPIGVFLWTGDCQPSESAIALAGESGMLAMNGGGGRFDRIFPSYAYLYPLSRQVGKQRQFYSPHFNENDYTGLWNGPYYGYRDSLETFQRTELPRRIKPVNVYVHFYTAERYASLEALRTVLAWTRKQPLIPIFASRYIRSVRDFFALRVSRAGPRRYRFQGGGDLRTIRFDGEVGWPDLSASRGVVGYRREGKTLYVSLDGTGDRELVLAEREKAGPRLEEANFEVEKWAPAGGGVSFLRQGWWTGECTLAGLAPGRAYNVKSGTFKNKLTADAAGRLAIRFPDSERGGPPQEVTVLPAR